MGKSFVAQALGVQACRQRQRVFFTKTALGDGLSSHAATIMAKHEGWERGRAASEVDAYVRYAARFRLR